MGRIFLITGPRGSGKTTLCRQFIELARARGWHVTGILTLKHTANSPGRAWSLHAQDLRTGETRPLAYRSPDGIRQWAFVEKTLTWGNRVLKSAVPTDLLVVDELGPLEWLEGRGWTAAFGAIDSGQYRSVLVVVRPELLEQARRRWPQAKLIDVTEQALLDDDLRQLMAGEGE